ncbi:MAG: ABC transporter substrate-binding protein [Desulfuromonadales bacterium]|nr:ABC transporter substrate-binding protein [Desulfuromonadales bacterium]
MPIPLLDLTVRQVIDRHPETVPVFVANGLAMFADPETRATFGAAIKLRTALKAAGANGELFVRMLDEVINSPLSPDNGQSVPGNLNLLALLPCPLKVPLEEAFNDFLATLTAEQRASLTFCIEGNANKQIEYADYADHFETLADMPDIIITPGFNSFYHPHFVERFIKTGGFTGVSLFAGDRHLSPLGMIDPDSHYTMLAMNLLVLVVDHTRLGNRPVPRQWSDLLKPEYEKSIAIRGNRIGTFCETLLLSLYKEFGDWGLSQLGRTVAWGWHPSQMVKAAGSGREDTPAISVMPLFFANTIKNRETVSIIWPDDGALVSPVTMLVKTEKQRELSDLIDFLIGPKVAGICAGASFPAQHPEVDNRLPDSATFKWIGWDYVKNNDLETLITDTNAAFLRSFNGETS